MVTNKNFISEWLFCVRDGKILLAEPGAVHSHLQWFRNEGWISNEEREEEEWFNKVICGSYFPRKNAIIFYKEAESLSEPEQGRRDAVMEAKECIENLMPYLVRLFRMRPNAGVYLEFWGWTGSEEGLRPCYLGTVKNLLAHLKKKEWKFEEALK